MAPSLRAGPPGEAPAVKTTIVGGRPPGSGTGLGPSPRGLEVLLKKAAVDAEFRALLLADRETAARTIELELTEPERSMLAAVPREQLEGIIESTRASRGIRTDPVE